MKNLYELDLPYFKQGDDLATAKKNSSNDVEAFRLHAEMLRESAARLDQMAVLAADGLAGIEEAGTHMIVVYADETVGDRLVAEGVLSRPMWLEDDEDKEEEWEIA